MTVDNPLGVDPDDPNGKDDIVVADPTFHLLVNQPVQVLLRSTDVLHDFAVPQFRVKMDLVPGLVTYQWFTPTVVGTYEMLCEELCGVGHFAMRGRMGTGTMITRTASTATRTAAPTTTTETAR